MGQLAINSMALPPILLAGKEWMKEQVKRRRLHARTRTNISTHNQARAHARTHTSRRARAPCPEGLELLRVLCVQVCRPVIRGDINCSLAISEPYVDCAHRCHICAGT
jgi:hypothetical protein